MSSKIKPIHIAIAAAALAGVVFLSRKAAGPRITITGKDNATKTVSYTISFNGKTMSGTWSVAEGMLLRGWSIADSSDLTNYVLLKGEGNQVTIALGVLGGEGGLPFTPTIQEVVTF